MTKRWHKSTKRKPKVGEDILIIWKEDKAIAIGTMLLDDDCKSYLWCCQEIFDWNSVAPVIKQWAYVDKYFEKELKDDKDNT